MRRSCPSAGLGSSSVPSRRRFPLMLGVGISPSRPSPRTSAVRLQLFGSGAVSDFWRGPTGSRAGNGASLPRRYSASSRVRRSDHTTRWQPLPTPLGSMAGVGRDGEVGRWGDLVTLTVTTTRKCLPCNADPRRGNPRAKRNAYWAWRAELHLGRREVKRCRRVSGSSSTATVPWTQTREAGSRSEFDMIWPSGPPLSGPLHLAYEA